MSAIRASAVEPAAEPPTLEQQMAAALAGDKAAYEQVLRTVGDYLARYLGRKLPPAARDDVVQEILLSLHKARHTYDASRPLLPWVMAIARFRLHDYWRRHYAHGGNDVVDIDALKNILAVDETKDLEAREDIRRVLQTLPPKQQQILDLMYRQDKSVLEVAALLQMSVSAVKVAAHRSYKVFRKRLLE